MKRNMYWILLLSAFLAAALLAGCSALPANLFNSQPTPTVAPVQAPTNVTAEGHVVPRDTANLFFTATGKVTDVLVKEGDKVSKGAVLARLGDRESIQAAVAAAQLELVSSQQQVDALNQNAALAYTQAVDAALAADKALTLAQQRLTALDTTEHQQKVDDANTNVSKAKDDLKTAQDDADKYSNLSPDNPTRKSADDKLKTVQTTYDQQVQNRDLLVNELEQAKADVESARTSQAEAARERDNRKNGPDPDQMALAQARLANAQAQLAAAQAGLARLDLVAPFDGTVVVVNISTGEQALPNQAVMVIADLSQWYVETSDLTETEVVKVKPGKSVNIVPDALPESSLKGTVDRISDNYIDKAGDITYVVRIRMDETDPNLRWGMTVNVTFEP